MKKPYQEQFERVQRFYLKIDPQSKDHGDQEEYYDNLLSFFLHAWHLKDWIKNDESIHGINIEDIVTGYKPLMICADIANRAKHFTLDNERSGFKQSKNDVTLIPPCLTIQLNPANELSRFDKKVECISHFAYYYSDDMGSEYEAIALAKLILNDWSDILANYIMNGLIKPERNRHSFKERARRHQIRFRKEILKVDQGEFETFLTEADALKGLIFYSGFSIFEVARKRLSPLLTQNKACYVNMLRSEHIPFNFFVPLANDLDYAKAVLNKFVDNIISKVIVIKIEHAPDPAKALKDKTSFDVYVEYIHSNGLKGVLGIEVKYTEKAYILKKGSKEETDVNDPDSAYNRLTRQLGIYNKEHVSKLKTDEYRQVWRNQLLGESMTKRNHPESEFVHFTSIILYPKGNNHFKNLIPDYKSFLNPGFEDHFMDITYEKFIETARGLTDDQVYLSWLQYLEDRYIVKY
jgi:hypothetical protein